MSQRPLRVYLTGAACAGVTTLGKAIAERLGVRHVDVDDFYWQPTDPPYTTKRLPAERVTGIRQALGQDGWVLSGSFDGWGDALVTDVSLIVFVSTTQAVRLQRLAAREQTRHGDRIQPGGDMYVAHLAFADWASQYDHPSPTHSGRNRARHEAWLATQRAPVLRVNGEESVATLTDAALTALAHQAPLHYLVETPHRSEYPQPITFPAGAPLQIGERYVGPEGWDDWYFCTTPGQNGGWVPAQVIEGLDNATGHAREAYTARELDVATGQPLTGVRHLNGWVWCERPADKASGWVPQANVRLLPGID